ncbi:MAG: diacylglycerol kinase family lipid kinase [Actinobacteria bacterium]|nr:diacylglycerol kinase family lipid kinase [Actinomycetota bacterium]
MTQLAVVGGDGTAYEVVNGVLGAGGGEVELAVLPRGTGRDFARSLGLPKRFDDAVQVALTGRIQTIDAGKATFHNGEAHSDEAWFANFAGAGISGAIARDANASSKALGGRASFLVSTVKVFAGWKSARVAMRVDEESRSGQMFEIVAMNGPYAGGGMRIAPDAVMADGLLDCVIFGDVTKLDFLTTFRKIYSGRHLSHPKIELLRGSSVTVEADPPLPVVLDGEQPGTTPARFEIVPRALRVRVPG